MPDALPSILLTGISGNLGRRLLPLLSGFRVVGVDLRTPETNLPIQFTQMDLSVESSCLQFLRLLQDVRPVAVVHLAFVMDAVRAGILDRDRIWQTNVAGTARVMEAVTEANREWPMVEKFLFTGSVAAYGTGLSVPATEETPLAAGNYTYGVQSMEADKVVQQRAPALRGCSVYILRPHIFAGAGVQTYFMEAFSGIPGGTSKRAARIREQGKRMPFILPAGKKYLENKIQFVHVDDIARLIAHILNKKDPEAQRLTVLNVAGTGSPVTYEQCIGVAKAKLLRLPGKELFELALHILWKARISTIPPDVSSFVTSDMLLNTSKLQDFLGADHKTVMRYSVSEAFGESFRNAQATSAMRA